MLDLLLPSRCALCGATGTGLCTPCLAGLPPAPDRAPPPGFQSCWSLLTYGGPTKDLVAALKFHHHRDAFALLGSAMADVLPPARRATAQVVTWAPTTTARRRRRGYDQAEELARAVAGRLGRPCRPMLRRADGAAQTGRTRAQRLGGAAFEPLCGSVGGTSTPARSVLVIDDVRTTGSTLVAAADALLATGTDRLTAVTLAVTL